ncbi:APC family permease [Halosimplex aquaticum]
MPDEQLGLTESVSIALGGMIGGGIYAVLGVVTGIAGAATWAAFALAGVVAACAGYSYNALNDVDDENQGGSVSFVQSFVGNATLAGMVGWTLLFGYVGSMAMYAFAFGEFTVALGAVPDSLGSVPLRPVVSVGAVAGFVGLNLLGAQATGTAENVLVALKVGVLVTFGVAGVIYVGLGTDAASLSLGLSQLTTFDPIVAAAVSFVAFQGWQLLFYDQESIADPVETIRTAVYVAIPVAVGIYALVAVATVALAPQALRAHPHRARPGGRRRRRAGRPPPGGRVRHLGLGAVLDRVRDQRDAVLDGLLREGDAVGGPAARPRRRFQRQRDPDADAGRPRCGHRRLRGRREPRRDHLFRLGRVHRRLRGDERPGAPGARPRADRPAAARSRSRRDDRVPAAAVLAPVRERAEHVLRGAGHLGRRPRRRVAVLRTRGHQG